MRTVSYTHLDVYKRQAWNYGRGQSADKPEFNYVKEVDYISGCSIMIRTALWREIGGFDERFAPAYCEDSDLAFAVRAHGYKVLYQPDSVVVHYEGVSNGTDLSAGQKQYQIENQKKLYQKWRSVLERENYPQAQQVFRARERGSAPCLLTVSYTHLDVYKRQVLERLLAKETNGTKEKT